MLDKKMKQFKTISASMISIIVLSSCAVPTDQGLSVNKSYLESKNTNLNAEKLTVNNAEIVSNPAVSESQKEDQKKFRFVPPLKLNTVGAKTADDILALFSQERKIKITAESLPLQNYLHYVLGEQLKVSYILAEEVKNDTQNVTLNLQDPITEQKLFTLTEELLSQRNYNIRFDDNIFYIHKNEAAAGKGNVAYGFGKSIDSVPQTSLEIIQMVPFEYGMQISLGNTLRQLLGVKAIPDQQRNSITIQGKRKDIIRALELIKIMDSPLVKDRHISVYQATFSNTGELLAKLSDILKQEGLSVGKGGTTNTALSVIELDKQSELIFFARNEQVINRALFWANEIDKPILTAKEQYFIYQPKYSRAIDMGDSLEALISGAGGSLSNSTSAETQNQQGGRRITSASSETMKMVVDERANAIIFFTSSEEYQQILPLIKRLDILPRQIMLEVTIAEVTLTDNFRAGVEFNLTNRGINRAGGFNLRNSSEGGLSYVLTGTRGNITATLLNSNTNVNILSRPSLMVRDGVTADISVGNDIPTVGEIVTDPVNGSQTSVQYRKTGVELKVKPTINARGVVIMEIDQKISNQATGDGSVAGSPIIFERSIGTEVIAQSGETVVLGGLISENQNKTDTSVPFFSQIPLIGRLFDSKSDESGKTELVVLVTPKVLESNDEWQDFKEKFVENLQLLKLNN